MNKLVAFIVVLILPTYTYAGFPEGERGYDLDKIKKSYSLQCQEIGNEACLARAITFGGCIYSFEINKGNDNEEALRNSYEVIMALLDGNILDINNIFEDDGSIKNEIRLEVISKINFCREATKEAIPKLFKLAEGIEMKEEKLEKLTNIYPHYYLDMFEKMKNGKMKMN